MANLLGDYLAVPSTGSLNAIDYAVASTNQLLQEGYAKVTDTFGDVAQFQRQAQGVPSYTALAPAAVSTSTYTAHAIKTEVGDPYITENTYHKVKLTSPGDDLNFPETVEFDIMPEVGETRDVEYTPLSPPQMPGEFQKYVGTKSVRWTITGTFTCRTQEEAQRNYEFINRIRSWAMPYFGDKQKIYGRLGAPPPVLRFSGWRGLVGEVPVVMTSANWNWTRDCDWIPTLTRDDKNKEWIPFPTVMNVTVVVVESFSALQFNNFDLFEFHDGRMLKAYPTDYTPPQDIVAEPVRITPMPAPAPKPVAEAKVFKAVPAVKAVPSLPKEEFTWPVVDPMGNVISGG